MITTRTPRTRTRTTIVAIEDPFPGQKIKPSKLERVQIEAVCGNISRAAGPTAYQKCVYFTQSIYVTFRCSQDYMPNAPYAQLTIASLET